MYLSLSRSGCLHVSLSSNFSLDSFGMISFSSENPAGILGATREERARFRSFTSGASALLGGMYVGSKFLSSRLAFLSLLVGEAGVVLVYLHFIPNFVSLDGVPNGFGRSALDNIVGIYGPQHEVGGF